PERVQYRVIVAARTDELRQLVRSERRPVGDCLTVCRQYAPPHGGVAALILVTRATIVVRVDYLHGAPAVDGSRPRPVLGEARTRTSRMAGHRSEPLARPPSRSRINSISSAYSRAVRLSP